MNFGKENTETLNQGSRVSLKNGRIFTVLKYVSSIKNALRGELKTLYLS
jgi:hypothetical protein